jgi:hypothetical protein
VPGFLLPFNYANKPGLYFECRMVDDQQTGTGSDLAALARRIVGTRVVDAIPAGDTNTSIPISKYEFAKIYISAKTGAVDENHKSRLTQRVRTHQASNNVSCPFGRITGDNNWQDAANKLRNEAAYKTFVEVKGQIIRITPEGV